MRQMRRDPRLSTIPVIMLTAKGLEMELGTVREQLGVVDILPKPFSVRQVVEKVEGCFAPAGSVGSP